MKKTEIEQELINLAKLRWNVLREMEEYIKDIDEYKKNLDNYAKQHPKLKAAFMEKRLLLSENFPMLPNENSDEFKE